MHESEVVGILKDSGVDMMISLPCDKNKGFTDLIHEDFEVVDVTREEDAVGISAGACLMGRRPAISIQSSGLGNMMNAIMSLTACYRLPMLVLASWRGMEGEMIEAQKMFNPAIPAMLDCYGIGHCEVRTMEDAGRIRVASESAFGGSTMQVVLIHPGFWEGSKRDSPAYPPRSRRIDLDIHRDVPEPTMTRLKAIASVMSTLGDDDIVVSNIGVPSKEVMASRDRPLNFYMLGSYTQATPIGLGMALSTDRRVVVIDGDGSLLGSSILPVLASVHPGNLTVVCLDNGTFGSTGNQINQAYGVVDLGVVAQAFGLDVCEASTPEEVAEGMGSGCELLHVMIVPFNSDSPNIPYSAVEIRDRFRAAL